MAKNDRGAESLTPLSFRILLALSDRERHGYGILKEIESSTEGETPPATGTLYLALQRLVGEGLIEEARQREGRRRYYRLTAAGKKIATEEARRLLALVGRAREKSLIAPALVDAVLGKRR